MGWNGYSLMGVDYVEVVSHTKKVEGKCPMCETEFNIEFDLKNGPTDYRCPCGYFRFDAEDEHLSEDNHGVPKKEWIKRCQQAKNP